MFKTLNALHPLIFFFVFSLLFLTLLNSVQFPITTLLKPLPIVCLMIYVLLTSLGTHQKKMLFIALSFSLLGDVGLTLPVRHQLELGLVCFLLAHLAYIRLFVTGIKIHPGRHYHYVAPIVILLISSMMMYSLMPYLGDLFYPVLVYVLVISLMAICALQLNLSLALGGMLFMLSDALIAFNKFIFIDSNYYFWIMITYYLAQLLIVFGSSRFFSGRLMKVGSYTQ